MNLIDLAAWGATGWAAVTVVYVAVQLARLEGADR